jgi:TIGR03118 family protein
MRKILAVLSLFALSLGVVGSAGAVARDAGRSDSRPMRAGASRYRVHRLVSDQNGHAKNTDPNLVNAWGIAAGPTTPWWVNAADGQVSTLYDGKGAIQPLVVDVTGNPTGLVFNGSPNFVVTDGTASGPSLFLFATESGTIRGWSPAVPAPAPSTQSFIVLDRSGAGASYKGLAIASTSAGDFLYAADFHNGQVDMFDDSFNLVSTSSTFVDPNMPAGYAPFGIQTIGNTVFVRTRSRTPTRPTRSPARVSDSSTPSMRAGRSWGASHPVTR